MAELRHSASMGNRATAGSSPVKRDDPSAPFVSASGADGGGRDRDRDRDKDPHRAPFASSVLHLPPPIRSLLALEDPRVSTSTAYRILVAFLAFLVLAGLLSLLSLWSGLNAPYLCRKEGIVLHCPRVKEPPSLWENPYSATTSWKPCAERREGGISDLPSENETNGYIFIHAEGGLNQQRIAICNAVAVAKIMGATLILPVLKQDQIWKDQTKFEDIFDVDHFIEYLKDDVRIVRDIPEWFVDKAELFTSIRRTVKNIPKYASADFYIDNVLPRIKEKKIMALKPFVDRLGYDNVPPEINRLRCRVNYHALKFLPEIEEMAEKLAARMRNRTGNVNPYMALHLRFEKGMVGLSFCDFVGTREEKAMMAAYRQKEWPRRYKNGSHLWQLALQKRKEGRCPLEPGEVAVILRAMGYPKETQIYVASGQVYGGKNRMAPLRNMFPNLVTKEELASNVQRAWDAFGRIDALINNAGVRGGVYSPLDWPEEDWNATFATNLTGLWLVTKYVCKQMVNANLKGTVINISSISGLNRGKLPGAIAYAVSKEGVNAITKVMALEMGVHNIRVNSISPGIFKSEITESLMRKKWIDKVATKIIPLRTFGTSDPAITSVVRYLIHDSSEYVTGNIFIVDAGATLPGVPIFSSL